MTTELVVRPATESDVRAFAEWRHQPPYDVYDITQPSDRAVAYFLRIGSHVIDRDGRLAAFFTFGSDARVPGGDYSIPALDIGLGVNPALVGQGLGRSLVAAVISFAITTTDQPLRVSIASSNLRAQRVWLDNGFVETQRFATAERILGSEEFVVLERPSTSESDHRA